ncbi:MAG: hypothetical protein IKB86_07740 [Clostridia bacterium]|nr:hypothetical protein [Clostridia bacterium]
MIEKYIKIYHRRNYYLALMCSVIVFIPFFVVSLIYDVIKYDILIAFLPFPIGAIFVALAYLYTIRFKKMIQYQEQLYNAEFNDEGVVNLETTLYLSKDWLIWAGSSAIYKKHIKNIRSKVEYGRAGSSNKVTITTVDGKKYIIWCFSATNILKIRRWMKEN